MFELRMYLSSLHLDIKIYYMIISLFIMNLSVVIMCGHIL